MNAVRNHLIALYGEELGVATFEKLQARIQASLPNPFSQFEQRESGEGSGVRSHDSILITYGDQLHEPDRAPLQSLAEFCDTHLRGVVSGIHLLPFYPYSSDDGFSVIDYKQINPALGTWDDVARFRQHFRLMFDGVINHISAQSEWFKAFLRADPK